MSAVLPFYVIIPARYGSVRLPGKPLAEILGKPMVLHVYDRARASGAKDVIIATDDERIATIVKRHQAEVCMTSVAHTTGTDRIAEAVEQLGLPDDAIVINVQGDEPLIQPRLIGQVAKNVADHSAFISTLCEPISSIEELFNPDVVKVVFDKNGFALYFSRATIPWDRALFGKLDEPRLVFSQQYRHIGLYGYKVESLREFTRLTPSSLETIECLEQLRALWHGKQIHVDLAILRHSLSVDTIEDLEKVRMMLSD